MPRRRGKTGIILLTTELRVMLFRLKSAVAPAGFQDVELSDKPGESAQSFYRPSTAGAPLKRGRIFAIMPLE